MTDKQPTLIEDAKTLHKVLSGATEALSDYLVHLIAAEVVEKEMPGVVEKVNDTLAGLATAMNDISERNRARMEHNEAKAEADAVSRIFAADADEASEDRLVPMSVDEAGLQAILDDELLRGINDANRESISNLMSDEELQEVEDILNDDSPFPEIVLADDFEDDEEREALDYSELEDEYGLCDDCDEWEEPCHTSEDGGAAEPVQADASTAASAGAEVAKGDPFSSVTFGTLNAGYAPPGADIYKNEGTD